jgi:LAS superfamily LD-carboxypeptidase LdcB
MYLTAALHELVSFPYNHYTITSYISQGVFMISMQELLKDAKFEDQEQSIQDNLTLLLERMNKVREAYGKSMVVTSGLRTMADHLRIYAAKGITDKSKIPMHSKHLVGLAVDIADSDGSLNQWCKDNVELLRDIGIWLENRQGGWQHFQVAPFGSYQPDGTIFFNP